ncbi:transposase DNA-binding-containing protein [Escherichia coli]|uniref:Transposase DNA-binding-containing protein n=1 Tax=Escherichia coli TaxID=562 RepID=A0AAP6EAY1_ECOLX|nr:transposase DNA-binding-containing protein [Escherichia coli]MDW9350434.1 transposase DNA-binding-containing protein [Escherichia coli]
MRDYFRGVIENWVIQELKSLDMGDSRLDKRVKHILCSLSLR